MSNYSFILYIFETSHVKCFSMMIVFFFFFKQKTAYEMRISDWISDVCSSDLIVGGIGMAAWGLLPRNLAQHIAASSKLTISAPEDAPLSWAHWRLMATLVVALVIDVMKPAALGFAIPGMIDRKSVV